MGVVVFETRGKMSSRLKLIFKMLERDNALLEVSTYYLIYPHFANIKLISLSFFKFVRALGQRKVKKFMQKIKK